MSPTVPRVRGLESLQSCKVHITESTLSKRDDNTDCCCWLYNGASPQLNLTHLVHRRRRTRSGGSVCCLCPPALNETPCRKYKGAEVGQASEELELDIYRSAEDERGRGAVTPTCCKPGCNWLRDVARCDVTGIGRITVRSAPQYHATSGFASLLLRQRCAIFRYVFGDPRLLHAEGIDHLNLRGYVDILCAASERSGTMSGGDFSTLLQIADGCGVCACSLKDSVGSPVIGNRISGLDPIFSLFSLLNTTAV
ncbi:hypothetical protein JOB18_043978 [Solea senegalensis]|uniref:Uncharacterized protein n=1 Tax=Solea senegalensis TaxID=28829 RepID=A0AAV6QXW4_SOLSE|nr:hypothetical protein JOB18_043978 [Solea senegalensis]